MKRVLTFLTCALALTAFARTSGAKTLRVAMEAVPSSMDPYSQLSVAMLQVSHMVFDPLIRWSTQMRFEPRLAEKWERLDPLTVRFHLRKGVKFHSGNPFTARDVVWTIERLKKSQNFKGMFDPLGEVTAVNDHTVDLKTFKPYGLTLNLCTYIFPMDSVFYAGDSTGAAQYDPNLRTGRFFANEHESGTGRFFVDSKDQDQNWVLKGFEGYWDKQTGNIDEIVLKPIKDSASRVSRLLAGHVDWIQPAPPQEFDRIAKSQTHQLITLNGTRVITLQLNQKRRTEFKDPRVRLAIVHALNNEWIVEKIMKGRAIAASQNSPAGYAGHVEELKTRFNLEKARALMKEAGHEKGFSVSMIAPNNRYINDERIAEAVAAMLGKINVRVELKTMPKEQYWDDFDAQKADIQMIGWHCEMEDSADFFESLYMCPNKDTGYGQYNSGNYCNQKVDELTLASQSETAPEQRSRLLQQAERILYEEAAFVPLHWQALGWAASKNIKNAQDIVQVMNFSYFDDLIME